MADNLSANPLSVTATMALSGLPMALPNCSFVAKLYASGMSILFLLPISSSCESVFLDMSDMAEALPELNEEVVPVELPTKVEQAYKTTIREIRDQSTLTKASRISDQVRRSLVIKYNFPSRNTVLYFLL